MTSALRRCFYLASSIEEYYKGTYYSLKEKKMGDLNLVANFEVAPPGKYNPADECTHSYCFGQAGFVLPAIVGAWARRRVCKIWQSLSGNPKTGMHFAHLVKHCVTAVTSHLNTDNLLLRW
ncbi:hypothetical protein MKX01_034067 [Papaver californicum]|nr:hypothetical protein MKX01_034067 [Papaver californicum]